MKTTAELSPRSLLTISEASNYLRCSKVTLYKRRKEGALTAHRAGGKVLFRLADLDKFLVKEKIV